MTTGLEGLSSSIAFRQFIQNPNRYLDQFRDDPTVQRDLEYFQNNIQRVESVDDLLSDFRLTKVVLGAYGLQDEVTRLGRIKRVMTEDPNSQDSLAFKLADDRFRELASDLRTDTSLVNLQTTIGQEKLFNNYVQNTFEVRLGENDPNLRKALTFARNIDESEGNVFNVLGDRVLRDVILDTLQIPQQIAVQSVNAQAQAVNGRIDLEKFVGLANGLQSTAQDIEAGQADISTLQTNISYTEAARTITTELSTTLQNILDANANLAADTDPAGANAADIAAQETAVPNLIRYEQLDDAQQSGLDTVSRELNTLLSRIEDARQTGADLATIQTDVSAAVGRLNDAITNAEITNTLGVTENPLLTGSGDVVETVTVNGSGQTFEYTRFDLSDIQAFANAADTFVSGTTDPNDTDLITAQSRILQAQERLEAVNETRTTEQANYQTTLDDVSFFATLDTAQLSSGYQTVTDALDRIQAIEDRLDQISDLTRESELRTPAEDRSDLTAQFETLREEIRTLITDTNQAGAVNVLNNEAGFTVTYATGASLDVAGGFDFLTDIMTDLDAESLATTADAQALRTNTILATIDTDNARLSLDPVADELQSAYLNFDPRGRVEGGLYEIRRSLADITAGAKVDGVNLLGTEQNSLFFDLESTSASLSASSDRVFQDEVQALLDTAIDKLTTNPTGFEAAVLDVIDRIDQTSSQLRRDESAMNFEFGRIGATLQILEIEQRSNNDDNGAAGTDYQANDFTLDFINRFLTLNDTSGSGGPNLAGAPNGFLLNLVQPVNLNAGGGGDPIGNILNLVS